MIPTVAIIQSGEPLTLSLLRTNNLTGAGEPLPVGHTLTVAVKDAPNGKVPSKNAPVLMFLGVTNGVEQDWLVTLTSAQSETLIAGFYALDGRIKNAGGATVIITDPALIVVEDGVTPP
jgi:hypothetical protein